MALMASSSKVYALILCGGAGSRLWPRSRSKHPKHLLDLNGGHTLVQETLRRLELPLDRVFCVTEASHSDLLKRQVPDIPEDNVVIEPDRRGTGPAIGLALTQMRDRLQDDDVVVSLHADALIRDKQEFQKTFEAWVEATRRVERIINLGIRPTYPSTGFGYINLGDKLVHVGDFDVFEARRFVEKPNQATATTYVDSGRYLWNSGMFAARAGILLEEMESHLKDTMRQLAAVDQARLAGKRKAVKDGYLALEPDTIDEGLLEKSTRLAVIPATFSWADVGSWADLHDVLERDEDGNVFEGEYVDLDSKDCFIYSPKQLVATVGLSNLVIINTDDAVLICPKDRSQDVKKIVEKLKASGKDDYL